MALCEVALSDGSDLLAEEMKFGLGWNSTSTTHTVAKLRPGTPIKYGIFCKNKIKYV